MTTKRQSRKKRCSPTSSVQIRAGNYVMLGRGLAERTDFTDADRYKECPLTQERKGHERGKAKANKHSESDLRAFLEKIGYKPLDEASHEDKDRFRKRRAELPDDFDVVLVAINKQGGLVRDALEHRVPLVFVSPKGCQAWGFGLDRSNLSGDAEEFRLEGADEWLQCRSECFCDDHSEHYHLDKRHLEQAVVDSQDELREHLGRSLTSVPVFPLSSAIDILRWQAFHKHCESYRAHEAGAQDGTVARGTGLVTQTLLDLLSRHPGGE